MGSADAMGAIGLFIFLGAGAVSLFSFLAVASWADARRRERESYYKNDMLKKLTDAQGTGANAALELLREESRLGALRKREGMRVGGVVVMATGLGSLIFLRALIPHAPVYLSGLLLLLIGVSLFGSSYLVTTAPE